MEGSNARVIKSTHAGDRSWPLAVIKDKKLHLNNEERGERMIHVEDRLFIGI